MDDDLKKLKKDLESAGRIQKTPPNNSLEAKTPIGRVFNVGVDLVAGVLVGVALGLLIDWYFNTSPFGLIILFLLGSGAGMLNVYRSLTKDQNKNGDIGSQDG